MFDLVFLDAEKDDYEALFALARPLLEPGGLVVADNVLSHADPLAAYSAARQADRDVVQRDRSTRSRPRADGRSQRTSDMSPCTLSSGSRKNVIQSSWSGIFAIRCGSSSNGTPRPESSARAAWMSSTRK